jgi:F-type H+-transporting ATPase subunit epsilon
MNLNVYSLQKVLFRGEATAVNCPTTSGEITILDHHRPLISILKSGVMKITQTDGKDTYIPVRSGFLEVRSGNEAKFLVEEDLSAQ